MFKGQCWMTLEMYTICSANLGQNLFLSNQASCQEFDLRWQVHTQKDRMPETEKMIGIFIS